MTPILIAADELRMFDEEPPIGESSSVAVDALKVLARLSQSAAISAHLKVGGPVYIAATAADFNLIEFLRSLSSFTAPVVVAKRMHSISSMSACGICGSRGFLYHNTQTLTSAVVSWR